MELYKEAIPEDSLILWGVGNHGGGASRLDLADIANTAKELSGKGINVIHSDPDTYDNGEMQITFNSETGLIDSYTVDGKKILSGN